MSLRDHFAHLNLVSAQATGLNEPSPYIASVAQMRGMQNSSNPAFQQALNSRDWRSSHREMREEDLGIPARPKLGEVWRTRVGGYETRIVATDALGKHPLVGLMLMSPAGYELAWNYDSQGRSRDPADNGFDLVERIA